MSNENIILPHLSCPFPESISPFADKVHQQTLEWVKHFRLVTNEKAFEHLQLSKFGWLSARAYPNAALNRLEIISDWNTWLFIIDDQCDESGLGKRPDRLSALHNRCIEILTGYSTKSNDIPLIHALHDIYCRLQPFSSKSWMLRFAKSAAEYFEATLWEAQNRHLNRWPDTDSYMLMRPFSGRLLTDIELIEIAENIEIPCTARAHPCLIKLASLTNNVVCWSNDIISLNKEKAHGDMHNLVLVMQHELNISLQEALNLVKKLVDAQIQQFQTFEKRLPRFSDVPNHVVKKYVAVLRAWMRGNLDWAYESRRYNVQQNVYQDADKKMHAVCND
ncbi:hypothetical protein SAMN05421690_100866 [Nitrosomonas sp. Nm51]|uniref:terpene synthase family protein n=1 Tax=Nitrosomonas sp. Nm51 TaxID=133720 RepID=UPI0008AB0FD7|nr:hypothetical protein [Nitrosomonas sp. Nm51]SER09932.1 hypothetical protein SAMN05421690_100866 [Nitrosomonas sp. Nm51]